MQNMTLLVRFFYSNSMPPITTIFLLYILLHSNITVVQTDSKQSVLRTLEYSIPDILRDHVDMVQPTTFFGLRAQKSGVQLSRVSSGLNTAVTTTSASEAVAGCISQLGETLINPVCLSNLYNYNSTVSTKNYTAGLMAIAGFLEEYPSPSDLAVFMKQYSKANAAQTYTCLEINGTNIGNIPCGLSGRGVNGTTVDYSEANLDVQYARAITQNIPNIYYSTYGSPPWLATGPNTNEPYLEFLNYMLSLNNSALPNTVSISYGDEEWTVPLDYATHVCNLFSQLGARGVSVLVASGDSGVGGNATTCAAAGSKKYSAAFPAGCPWVTAVGGTQDVPEIAWSGSGAGFSGVFGRPSYQNDTVTKWLSTADATKNSKFFNSSGRAYPDISAQAFNFEVVQGGSVAGLEGTSCATPTFASIIQLLSSDRIASGKTGLGFLNPWLYSKAVPGLNDITSGTNPGACGTGFSAVVVSLALMLLIVSNTKFSRAGILLPGWGLPILRLCQRYRAQHRRL
jgi:tripeptidyl-peptidase I